jgi:hypothetical protein
MVVSHVTIKRDTSDDILYIECLVNGRDAQFSSPECIALILSGWASTHCATTKDLFEVVFAHRNLLKLKHTFHGVV